MKIFVISMETPQGQQRLETMKSRLTEAGFDSFEHVPGINIKSMDVSEVQAKTTGFCRMFCTPAMMGCMLSHIECWKRIVDQDLQNALVLEDDAVLVPNFQEKLKKALDSVPSDYHVLLLGCFMCDPFVQTLLGASPNPSEDVREIKSFGGAHAMVVSNGGARYLLDRTAKKASYHVDIQMSVLRGLRVYATNKDISFQADMTTSQIADVSSPPFPGTINTLLTHIKTSKNISLVYYANSPFLRIGTLEYYFSINAWMLVFFIFGLLGLSWKMVLLAAAADVIIIHPSSGTDPAAKLGAFGLGLLAHAYVFKARGRGR